MAFIAALLLLPFGMMPAANLFHKDGYVEKIGSFSSVLTGFYVAGLLAVATFATALGDLDKKIERGPIILPARDQEIGDYHLTRREYVCQMFGYLAALSLLISVLSIIVVVICQTIGRPPHTAFGYIWDFKKLRLLFGGLYDLLVAHLIVTTAIGLYYFVDRLYVKEPKISPKPKRPPEE